MPKPFAAFDVDGTVFKSSLVEKAVDSCVQGGLFDPKPFEKVRAQKARWHASNNEGLYQSYLMNLVEAFVGQMAGTNVEEFKQVTAEMIAQQRVRRFGFPGRLIEAAQDSHTIVAISGSPVILVEPFLEGLGVDKVYGSVFGQSGGVFTGSPVATGDKSAILQSLIDNGDVLQEGSIAVGDTSGDIPMLELADRSVAFNASRTLTKAAASHPRWFRVNEVKDQTTALAFSTGQANYVEMDPESIISRLTAA